jgi:hypothetical protein
MLENAGKYVEKLAENLILKQNWKRKGQIGRL